MEEYLSRFHRHPEGLATVRMIGNSIEERPNKIVVSLLNVERETAGGIAAPLQHTVNGGYVRRHRPYCSDWDFALSRADVCGLFVFADGTNIKVQAKMGAIIKGNATAELSASGQTTVKGAMVMIN